MFALDWKSEPAVEVDEGGIPSRVIEIIYLVADSADGDVACKRSVFSLGSEDDEDTH